MVAPTTFEADDVVPAALRSGASGFQATSVEPDERLDAVRVVARGDALLSPAATRSLITRFLTEPTSPSATARSWSCSPGRPDWSARAMR